MTRKRAKVLLLTSNQIRALRSAVRQEIVDAAQASGPCSVVELASLTGRAADSLYFHLRKLLKVGLLEEVAVRRSGRRDETIYDVPATRFQLEKPNIEPGSGVSEMIEGAINLATRDLRRVVESGDAIAQGPGKNIAGGRHKAWLTQQELAKVDEHLKAITEIYSLAQPGPERALTTFAIVLCPAQVNERKRSSPNGNGSRESDRT